MSRRQATIEPDYFDGLYTRDPDPWRFRSSAYEGAKYDDTLALLGRLHYQHALEIGCSIGVFTRRLVGRCEHLLGIDASVVALETARASLADLPNVRLARGMAPRAMPEGRFDLIVASEVIYYLTRADAQVTMHWCCDHLERDGEIVLCHWLGETDYPLTGEEAGAIAAAVGDERGFAVTTLWRDAYRLDRLRAPA